MVQPLALTYHFMNNLAVLPRHLMHTGDPLTAPASTSLTSPDETLATAIPLHQLNVAVLGQDRTFAQPLIDMLLLRAPSTLDATDEATLYDTDTRRLHEASHRFLLPPKAVGLSPCWIGTVDGSAKEQTWATLQALDRLLPHRWTHVNGVFLVVHRMDPALFTFLYGIAIVGEGLVRRHPHVAESDRPVDGRTADVVRQVLHRLYAYR